MLGVFGDPPVVDEPDGHGVQVVELLAAHLLCDDEAGLLEHAQMLHDAEAGHLVAHLDLELGQRPPVPHEQQVEEEAPRRIRERLEDAIVVCHGATIGD